MGNGFNISEEGHPVVILAPGTIENGISTLPFHIKWADHVSILIAFGSEGGSPPQLPSAIAVSQCTSAAGTNPIPVGSFRYYFQTSPGAGNDVLDGNAGALPNTVGPGPNWTESPSGIVFGSLPGLPASVAGLQFVIELDSAELEAITCASVGPQVEYPYVVVVITNGNSPTYCSILAVLSGIRWAEKVGLSVTT